MNPSASIEGAGMHPRAAECQVQLNKILSSSEFEATDREHRFLASTIEQALSGRGNRIKAYSIVRFRAGFPSCGRAAVGPKSTVLATPSSWHVNEFWTRESIP
jgi:hypothetical protein